MTTTIYKSDALIGKIEEESGSKFNAAQRSAIQKHIRKFFTDIHKEACIATEIAKNKREYIMPNFFDELH